MHDGDRSQSLFRLAVAILAAITALALTLVPSGAADAASSDPTLGLRGVDFARAANDLAGAASEARLVRATHGDLDGDGDEDAAVVLSYRENDRAYWSVQAYRNDGGVAVPAGRTHSFSDEWEHFDRMLIAGGIVEFTVASGQAQPTGWLTTNRWDLIGGDLRLLETIGSGSLVTLTRGGSQPSVPEYWTTTYIDLAPDAVEASFRFSTAERESVQLQSDDPTAAVRVYSAQTGDLITVLDTSAVATLPAGGSWIGVPNVSSDRSVRLLLSVADQRALYAPQLSVRMRESGSESSEPHRSVSLAWHEVTWAHGDVDVDRVNAQIRSFVDEIEREHLAAAAGCPGDTDATLYVGSTPQLISYDLVSFEFSIASCLCEENDEVRYRSLTIDLSSGNVLNADDVLPGGTAAASTLWWNEVIEHRDWIVESDLHQRLGTPVTFSSVSVNPWGVELTVRGSDLANDITGPVTVHAGWEELDGIVDPNLAIRAASGQDVQLPSEGCGC